MLRKYPEELKAARFLGKSAISSEKYTVRTAGNDGSNGMLEQERIT